MPLGRQVLTGKPPRAAGQRDRRVLIQQSTDGIGTSGRPIQTWTTLSTAWVSRRDLRADERFGTEQLSALAEAQWVMAYRADMDPELVDVPKRRRIVYQNRTFDILAASLVDGGRDSIELITLASSKVS